MIINKLDITSFRNIDNVSIAPHPALNLLTGDNGSGKSSVLEAIQCIATGHSFRTRKPRELITHSASSYQLSCCFSDQVTEMEHRAGLLRSRDGTVNLRLDFEDLKTQSTIAALLPVKAMTPDSHRLIVEGPDERRQFLDWGLFHVEPGFLEQWRDYRRSLSQRNQLLRDVSSTSEIETWNPTLISTANAIDKARKSYLHLLAAALKKRMVSMKSKFHVELRYRSGWDTTQDLEELLKQNLPTHRKMKTTTDGPHRADLVILSEQIPAKQVLSRGQLKVLVYMLHLAQLDILANVNSNTAIVICDDLTSELDPFHADALIEQLNELQSQVFISGIDLDRLSEQPHKRFHMEHGQIKNRL